MCRVLLASPRRIEGSLRYKLDSQSIAPHLIVVDSEIQEPREVSSKRDAEVAEG